MDLQRYLSSTYTQEYFKNFFLNSNKAFNRFYIYPLGEQGDTSVVYSLLLTYVSKGLIQRRDFVLKAYRKGCEVRGYKEFAVLRAFKEHNLPVPTAYLFETDEKVIGKPFILMERIAGTRANDFLNEETSARVIVDKMAEALVRLHKLDPSCIEQSNYLQEQYKLQLQQLLKMRFFVEKSSKSFFGFSSLRQNRFLEAVNRLEKVEPKKFRPAILHADYWPHNVLVSNGQVYVLDWGEACVGDPAFDVAETFHRLRILTATSKVDLGEHFVKCYEQYNGQRLDSLQFHKDMNAIRIAIGHRFFQVMTPFSRARFLFFGKLEDYTLGNAFGKLIGAATRRLQSKSNRYELNYAVQYLERDRLLSGF